MEATAVIKRLDETGTFLGLAAGYGLPDRVGDVLMPGTFAEAVRGLAAGVRRLPVLWQHRSDEPVGAIVKARELDEGLEVEGRLALEVPRAREAYALAKAGALSLSVGFSVRPGGAESRGGRRVIKSGDLVEVSLVATPANERATVAEVKAVLMRSPRHAEELVREHLGLSAREAKRLIEGGYAALAGRPGADLEPAPGVEFSAVERDAVVAAFSAARKAWERGA